MSRSRRKRIELQYNQCHETSPVFFDEITRRRALRHAALFGFGMWALFSHGHHYEPRRELVVPGGAGRVPQMPEPVLTDEQLFAQRVEAAQEVFAGIPDSISCTAGVATIQKFSVPDAVHVFCGIRNAHSDFGKLRKDAETMKQLTNDAAFHELVDEIVDIAYKAVEDSDVENAEIAAYLAQECGVTNFSGEGNLVETFDQVTNHMRDLR